jgi:prolyl-tRNA synthetase
VAKAVDILNEIQNKLLDRAKSHQQQHIREINNLEEFKAFFTPKNAEDTEIHGGFAYCYAIDDSSIEDFIKPLKVTARCMPLDQAKAEGTCIFTGKPANRKVLFAKSY